VVVAVVSWSLMKANEVESVGVTRKHHSRKMDGMLSTVTVLDDCHTLDDGVGCF
jgi:hypothetical protein